MKGVCRGFKFISYVLKEKYSRGGGGGPCLNAVAFITLSPLPA
jgi:hypothetical protein